MRKIDKDNLQGLQKQLQRKFDFAYPTLNVKSFFIGVADYVNVVESSDYLKAIKLYAILEARDKLDKQIDDSTADVVKEVTQTYDEIAKFIANKKIDNPNVNAEVKEYQDFVKGTLQISGYGNYGTYLSDEVRDIILAIEASGYKDKIKDYGIYDQNGIRNGWKISEAEQKLDGLLARRREEREARVWGAWEDIWHIYDAIYNKFDRWEQVVKAGKFLDKLSFGSFYGKVKLILEDNRDVNSHYPFEVEDYKRHFFRVNEDYYR